MSGLSFKHHRFPGSIICQAVRWYFRFTLSIRDVEGLMAERGVEVSREAIRCWVNKFGPRLLQTSAEIAIVDGPMAFGRGGRQDTWLPHVSMARG